MYGMVCGVYRSTGRLGVIEISYLGALSTELPSALPPSVLEVFARIRLPGQEVSVAALDAMLRSRDLELAAEQLADADVNLITFACTSGSFIPGPGWDQELLDDLGNTVGRPVISSNLATIWDALRRMNVIPSRTACFAARRSGAAGLVRLGNDSSEQQVHHESAPPSPERKQ